MGERNDGSFGFEKLDVYQAAVQFIPLAGQVIVDLTPGYHPYADQLRRAALSIAVNIAEGVGRTNPDDRRRHYGIARGSAMARADSRCLQGSWRRKGQLRAGWTGSTASHRRNAHEDVPLIVHDHVHVHVHVHGNWDMHPIDRLVAVL